LLDISGSAWESYKKTGKVNDMTMPEGLKESDKLEKPLWTPRFVTLPLIKGYSTCTLKILLTCKFSTKAAVGGTDENISPEKGP
jgi:phosphoribosylaminoimidazole-succinocarboxamide synthase